MTAIEREAGESHQDDQRQPGDDRDHTALPGTYPESLWHVCSPRAHGSQRPELLPTPMVNTSGWGWGCV